MCTVFLAIELPMFFWKNRLFRLDCSISSSMAGDPRVFPTKHYKISFKWKCLKLYLFSRLYTFIYLNERFLRARRLHIIVSASRPQLIYSTRSSAEDIFSHLPRS